MVWQGNIEKNIVKYNMTKWILPSGSYAQLDCWIQIKFYLCNAPQKDSISSFPQIDQ